MWFNFMTKLRIIVVAAFTSRSQTYIQAFSYHDVNVDGIITFGNTNKLAQAVKGASIGGTMVDNEGIFMPDLSVDFKECLKSMECPIFHVDDSDINSNELYNVLAELDADIVIYSGYGGQIVGRRLLNLGPLFIHAHSGWLPEYRGSTTMYYSWLQENYIGVSVIKMSEGIDQGDILIRRKYPVPQRGIDPDYCYDSAVRATTLVDFIRAFELQNGIYEVITQSVDEGTEYYVIHPLLKHVALLSREVGDYE